MCRSRLSFNGGIESLPLIDASRRLLASAEILSATAESSEGITSGWGGDILASRALEFSETRVSFYQIALKVTGEASTKGILNSNLYDANTTDPPSPLQLGLRSCEEESARATLRDTCAEEAREGREPRNIDEEVKAYDVALAGGAGEIELLEVLPLRVLRVLAKRASTLSPRSPTTPGSPMVNPLSPTELDAEQRSVEAMQQDLSNLQEQVLSMPKAERKKAKKKMAVLETALKTKVQGYKSVAQSTQASNRASPKV